MKENRRLHRLADLMQAEIAAILQREVSDPRIGLVSVTRVELSPDMMVAKVHVSPVIGDDESRKACKAGLRSAAGRIRYLLGSRLELRHVPELLFRLDDSIEKGDRVLSLLDTIRSEDDQDE